ncbi:hypothetical protein [Polaromonas sp. SM01]|uniref:hypothetical protein n=1 Tax=Polaromonas sp. SM01 TaxID=3085630 RepID=UPI0029829E64|nr:hypothetical protein [Polaromonas sp. SM01]MDW5441930.1 hypothetical protein [Polaromonas sp. SM01]
MKLAMTEVLCGPAPAVLPGADLARTLAFYQGSWGFTPRQYVPGVMAVLVRETLTLQLWQRRADMKARAQTCRLVVDCLQPWQLALVSAPGRAPQTLVEQAWGTEWGLSDCDGNRLLLVQPALQPVLRQARA